MGKTHPKSPAQARRCEQLTRARQARFLAAVGQGYSIRHAAATAGVSTATVYTRWLADPAFAEAYRSAVEQGTQAMEDEARRRAVEGVARPVYQGGKLVGHVQEYSDRLLEFLLGGRRPAMYRHNVHMTGQTQHEHSLAMEAIRRLRDRPDERRAIIARALNDAGAADGTDGGK